MRIIYLVFIVFLTQTLVLLFLGDIVNFLLVDGLSEEVRVGNELVLTVILKNIILTLGFLFMLACGLYFLLQHRLSFKLDFLTIKSFKTKPSDQKLLGITLTSMSLLAIAAIAYQVFTITALIP